MSESREPTLDETVVVDVVATDPSDRGQTTIGPSVVAKLARQAAAEVDGVTMIESSGLRRLFSNGVRDESTVAVTRGHTSINLEVGIEYPLPVRDTSQRLRDAVIARVESVTGLRVGEVNVTVSELRLGVD